MTDERLAELSRITSPGVFKFILANSESLQTDPLKADYVAIDLDTWGGGPPLEISRESAEESWAETVTDVRYIATACIEFPELVAEVRRLKDRLNHQTEDEVEACRQGKHKDCGRT